MSSLLLIDAGNTRLKWAEVTPRGTIRLRGQVEIAKVTPRWVAGLAKSHRHHRTLVASVVPRIATMVRRAIPDTRFVTGAMPGLPLAFRYPKPSELSGDRIAAAVAAGKGPAIVIACGTATAFSVLDQQGRFCGGAILPGVATQFRALAGSTAQLPAVAPASVSRALGKSTAAALRAGVVLGWQGGVRNVVTRLQAEVGSKARVIVTGGEATHLRGVEGLGRVEFRPLLVFEGLRMIAGQLP